MFIGFIVALLNGVLMPGFSLIFGEMVDSFGETQTPDEVVDDATY